MKGIWKRLAILTIMATLVLCLLPNLLLTAHAAEPATEGLYTLNITRFYSTWNASGNVNEKVFLYPEIVDLSITSDNKIVLKFHLRYSETTRSSDFTVTVPNQDCRSEFNVSIDGMVGESDSMRTFIEGTLTRQTQSSHTGGTATCIAKAKCSVCGEEYGEVKTDAHSWGNWTYENGNHNGVCAYNSQHTTSGNCEPGEDGNCTVCNASLVASVRTNDKILYFTDADAALKYADDYYAKTVTILKNATVNRGIVDGNLAVKQGAVLTLNPDDSFVAFEVRGSVSGGGTICTTGKPLYVESSCKECTFVVPVTVSKYGVILSGTFKRVVQNYGIVEDGTFEAGLVNYGTVKGGTVHGTLENAKGKFMGEEMTGVVYADDIEQGTDFKYLDKESCCTVKNCKHKNATSATCMEPQKCPFHCTGLAPINPNAHSLSYAAAGNVITETCAHGCDHSATATLNITEGNFTYNGQPHNVAYVAYTTETWKGGDLIIQYADNDNVNAGTRTATIQIDEATATKEFTINKATPTGSHFNITLPQNAVYDGTAKAATVAAADGITGMGTISIAYYKGTDPLNETPKDAGTYTVDLTIAEGDNFTSASLKSAAGFTIAKAETVKTAPVAITGLVYDCTPKALITAGEASDAAKAAGYKMMYMLEKEGAVYTDTVPTATDAGTYKIIWHAGYDNDNFKLNSGTIEVTIAKADAITTAPTANTLTYNSKPQQLVSGGISNWGSIEYKLDNGDWSYSIPTATNAGSYTVYYRIQLGENFNNVAETAIPVELAPFNFATATAGNAKIGLLGTPFVYDGTAKTGTPSVVVTLPSADPGSSSIEVNLTEGTDFTVDYENNVKAGTFTATFTGKGNYTGVVTRNYEIGKEALTLTVEDQTITYGEEIDSTKYTVTGLVTGDTAAVTLTPSTDQITNSGTITAEITVKNAAGEDVTECYTIADSAGNLVINAKPLTETAVSGIAQTYDHTGKGLTPAIVVKDGNKTLVKGTDYDVTFTDKDGKTVEKPTDHGEYKATVTFKGNYSGSAEKTFKIVAPTYAITKGNGGKYTDGSTKNLSFTANGLFSKFTGLEVNGKTLDTKYYTAKSGSTVVTLKASYLDTLSPGKYALTFLYTDGKVSGDFTVQAKTNVPATGDSSDLLLWVALLFAGMAAMITFVFGRKRKKS